jgi:tetratricopeptide (TPR) repeat protein
MLPPKVMLTIKKRRHVLHILGVISILGLTGCGPPGVRDLHKGEHLLDHGQYADAIPVLKESVELLRQSPSVVQAHAWNLLGLAYHGAGQGDTAAQAYGQALKLDRNLWAADYNLGCLRLEQGNYQGAVDYLTTYTTSHSQDYTGYLLLGRARLRMAMEHTAFDRNRNFDNAKMDIDYAEQLHPSAEGCNALGLIELLRHNPTADSVKTAVGYFETALQRTPHYPPALLNLAIVQQRYLNSPKEALATYKEYLTLQPAPADAAEVQKVAHQLDLDMRITITPKMVERPAPAPTPQSNAAPVHREAPSTEATPPRVAPTPQPNYRTPPPETRAPPQPAPVEVRVAENPKPHPAVGTPSPPVTVASSSSPQNPTPPATAPETETPQTTSTEERKTFVQKLNPLSWFSGKPKKTNAVERTGPAEPIIVERYSYPLYVTPIPGDRVRAQQLTAEGRQAQHNSNPAAAMRDFQAAMKADPTLFEPALALGLMALDQHNYATALDALGQALMVQPSSADARYAFAWVLGKKGYYQDAANELEKLLAAHPNEVRAHLLLGNIYADDLGQPKLARQQYMKSLELVDPQSSQAETIRAWLEQNQR